MTSTLERTTSNKPPAGKKPKDLGPVGVSVHGTPQRRRQLPWAVLGVLLVAGSVLAFALWSQQQAERIPVLVAASDIDAGAVIDRGDVTLISIGSDPGVRLLDATQQSLVVGQVARGPIPQGTPFSELLVVAETDSVPAGQAVVGAPLSPGEYPTSALRAGDIVQMVRVLPRTGVGEQDVEILGTATVWTIEDLFAGSEPRLFVSLLVEDVLAPEVANAVSQDQFRLVLVGSGDGQ